MAFGKSAISSAQVKGIETGSEKPSEAEALNASGVGAKFSNVVGAPSICTSTQMHNTIMAHLTRSCGSPAWIRKETCIGL